jgi:hypothetical protein
VVVVVLDVTSEETEEVWVDVIVVVVEVDDEVAILWAPPSKKAEARMAMIKIARTAPTAALLISLALVKWGLLNLALTNFFRRIFVSNAQTIQSSFQLSPAIDP